MPPLSFYAIEDEGVDPLARPVVPADGLFERTMLAATGAAAVTAGGLIGFGLPVFLADLVTLAR